MEQRLRFAEPPHASSLAPGESRAAGADYIHCLEWQSGEPALSVHVYSPPLAVVGQYRSDDSGFAAAPGARPAATSSRRTSV